MPHEAARHITDSEMKLLHCLTLLLSLHFGLTNEVFKPFTINRLGNEKNTYALNAEEKLYKDEENTEIGSNRDVFVYKVDNIPVIGARQRNEETHNTNYGIGKPNILINARRRNSKAKDRGKSQKKKDNNRIIVSNNGVTVISEEIERPSKISWLHKLFRYITKIIHSSKARQLDVRQIIYDNDTGTMVVNRGANRFQPYYVYVPKKTSPAEHDDRGNDSEKSNIKKRKNGNGNDSEKSNKKKRKNGNGNDSEKSNKKKRKNGNAGGSNKENKTENPNNINDKERVTEERYTSEEGTGGIEISNIVQDAKGDIVGNITINGKTYKLEDFKDKYGNIKLET